MPVRIRNGVLFCNSTSCGADYDLWRDGMRILGVASYCGNDEKVEIL